MYIDWTDLDGPMLELRARGVSWLEIGESLGVSHSALMRRTIKLGLRQPKDPLSSF